MDRAIHPLHELLGPARGRLLEALRSSPESGIHRRELSRVTGFPLCSLQRELGRLSSLGLLRKKKQGSRMAFDLKREEPLVKLLLAMVVALELREIQLGRMPADRDTENVFVGLCAHFPPDAKLWKKFGDAEFLAGVAVLLSGHSGFDRPAYLAVAESLSRGSSTLKRHEMWHRAHRPNLSRLFSMIDRERRTHARAEDQ